MRRILLVEPFYRNKYPPLGLMKLSTYHKLKGDLVEFVKGCKHSFRSQKWDRIYISTLFTFYWNETIKTINYYIQSVDSPKDIFVGGVMATLFREEIEQTTGVTVISGLINRPGILGSGDRYIVDGLIPDQKILDEIDYEYGLKDAYIGYATRGCLNQCGFCAVSRLEPEFVHYLPLKKQVKGIEEVYGTRQNLVLLDNNVLASDYFERIVNDIIELGFHKGAILHKKQRTVDFNQGLDARLLTSEKMVLLSKTAIKPLRLAFDFISMKDSYVSLIHLARDNGLLNLSTYVLYNYSDTPQDFYKRLRINVQLNEKLGTKIYSFPMKFIPLNAKDRSYIGKYWNKKLLRGVQCILLATKGKVSPRLEFFEAAFGETPEEFIRIAMMPDDYIIYRQHHMLNGAFDWKNLYDKLSKNQKTTLIDLLSKYKTDESILKKVSPSNLRKILMHYIEADKLAKIRKKGSGI